jgi:DNA mismatch endonuclease (patch repair protein)
MQAVKSQGTRLEKKFFAILAGMGISGWRKNPRGITGNPDAIFPDRKIVIFIDGCFWHGCPHCQRKLPKTNAEYWENKINRNMQLAQVYNEQLERDGWVVVRVWEHEFSNLGNFRRHLRQVLDIPRAQQKNSI